jgi:general transcription factor 3C polypeptide 3 (transcription factor C subunit 4)
VVFDSSFGRSRNYFFASCFQRGRQHGPVLSHQVRALIGEGNQAYVDENIPEAIRIMQEVIRIEPRASSAWSVIAQCYEDSNEPKKALQLRIMAAHLRHDADEWERLGAQSRWGRYRLSLKGTLTDGTIPQKFGL